MTNTLRVLRAMKRLPQWKVARRSRIGFNRYWRIENGHTEPTEQEQAKLASVFRVTVPEAFPPKVPPPIPNGVRHDAA